MDGHRRPNAAWDVRGQDSAERERVTWNYSNLQKHNVNALISKWFTNYSEITVFRQTAVNVDRLLEWHVIICTERKSFIKMMNTYLPWPDETFLRFSTYNTFHWFDVECYITISSINYIDSRNIRHQFKVKLTLI